MDDKPVESIRESSRNMMKLHRRFLRDEQTDSGRSVTNTSITSETIQTISNILKTKSTITVSKLQTLKNGVMEDPKYIEIILNTHGALRGLVRELTGKEVRKQVEAAGCLCNLGLGDGKAGTAVAKAAGPYLISAADNLSTELAMTCAWALSTVGGSGPRAAIVLTSQGALHRLAALVRAGGPRRDAALYALAHFTVQLKDELSLEHLQQLVEAISEQDIDFTTTQLLFYLSCHKDFRVQFLPDIYVQNLLSRLPLTIENHLTCCVNMCVKDCYLLYLIRILANFNLDETIYSVVVDSLAKLSEGLKLLLSKEDSVSKSVLWMLGNLYNFRSDHKFFEEFAR